MWANLQDLQNPEQMYRALGCKMVVGMPFKDQATSDTLYMPQIPPSSDKAGRRALKRLQVPLLNDTQPILSCLMDCCPAPPCLFPFLSSQLLPYQSPPFPIAAFPIVAL